MCEQVCDSVWAGRPSGVKKYEELWWQCDVRGRLPRLWLPTSQRHVARRWGIGLLGSSCDSLLKTPALKDLPNNLALPARNDQWHVPSWKWANLRGIHYVSQIVISDMYTLSLETIIPTGDMLSSLLYMKNNVNDGNEEADDNDKQATFRLLLINPTAHRHLMTWCMKNFLWRRHP